MLLTSVIVYLLPLQTYRFLTHLNIPWTYRLHWILSWYYKVDIMTYCSLVVIIIYFNCILFIGWVCGRLKWPLIGFIVRFLAHVKQYNIISHLVPTALGHKLTAVSPFNQSWGHPHFCKKHCTSYMYILLLISNVKQCKLNIMSQQRMTEKLSQPVINLMNNYHSDSTTNVWKWTIISTLIHKTVPSTSQLNCRPGSISSCHWHWGRQRELKLTEIIIIFTRLCAKCIFCCVNNKNVYKYKDTHSKNSCTIPYCLYYTQSHGHCDTQHCSLWLVSLMVTMAMRRPSVCWHAVIKLLSHPVIVTVVNRNYLHCGP